MASSLTSFISREEYKNRKALDEARKAGKIPAAVDEEGKDINPHMPQYIIQAPWYLEQQQASLKHQKWFKVEEKATIAEWYARGQKGYQAKQYRKGACQNCGALTHNSKFCFERPRQDGAKFTNKDIKADDIIVELDLTYDGKRDRWNNYDPESNVEVITEYEVFQNERQRRQEQELNQQEGASEAEKQASIDSEFIDQGTTAAEMAVTDPKIKTSTRDLRIREDRAKYLINLDSSSAFFDPKSRAMRENPNPNAPAEKQIFKGENDLRMTADAAKILDQERFVWNHVNKNPDALLNSIGLPTFTENAFKKLKNSEQSNNSQLVKGMIKLYGGAEHLNPDLELTVGQTEKEYQYEFDGNQVKVNFPTYRKTNLAQSQYEEDVYYENHTSVWGSWWNEHLGWGYACCHSNTQISDCKKQAGFREALQREYRIRKQKEDDLQKFIKDEKIQVTPNDIKEMEKQINHSLGPTQVANQEEGEQDFQKPVNKANYKQESVAVAVAPTPPQDQQIVNQVQDQTIKKGLIQAEKQISQQVTFGKKRSDSISSDSSSSSSSSSSNSSSSSSSSASQSDDSGADPDKKKKQIQISKTKSEKMTRKRGLNNKQQEQPSKTQDKKDQKQASQLKGLVQKTDKQKQNDSNNDEKSSSRSRSRSRQRKQKKLLSHKDSHSHGKTYQPEHFKNVDKKKVNKFIEKEKERVKNIQIEKDDRKRQYNSLSANLSSEPTLEEIEAYRLTKRSSEDPMNQFLD